MDKTKKIIEISKKILKDFNREYEEDSFTIFKPEEIKNRKFSRTYPYDVWEILIRVPQEQFGGTGVFSIYFKDETMEPFKFHDGGAPGRVPDLEILKKNGKYVIGDEWKNE
ncbi:hypothetical protein C8J95_10851 [Elizabethkingia sp. YR214]|uniref:hypothetical protein n=1 Tax=Elizabethkingia sp. YR214 TaxID=2135667 RepID=UPI000D2F86CF|nr:hypothetical protein [Elizabethkingia sp. YR214]PUB28107.1 hypothetical protein C8J95_10851 [Elizabethkingia sp. YR214]